MFECVLLPATMNLLALICGGETWKEDSQFYDEHRDAWNQDSGAVDALDEPRDAWNREDSGAVDADEAEAVDEGSMEHVL